MSDTVSFSRRAFNRGVNEVLSLKPVRRVAQNVFAAVPVGKVVVPRYGGGQPTPAKNPETRDKKAS